jgi:hypothetical protein
MKIDRLVIRSLAAGWVAVSTCMAAEQLQVLPGADVYLFSGRAGKVPVTVRNTSDETVTAALEYRFFQASSATIAPLDEKKAIGEKTFPAELTVSLEIPFTLPEVRSVSAFVAKLYTADKEIGAVNVTVVPPKIFSRLKQQEVGKVQVIEPDAAIRPMLEQSELPVVDESDAETKVRIVRLLNADAESDWKDRKASPTIPTLFIVSRGVTGAEKLLPVKFLSNENGRIAMVQDWFVPELQENALSQLRLLRALQMLLAPEAESDPSTKKK